MGNLPAQYKNLPPQDKKQISRLFSQMYIPITNQIFKEKSLYIDGYRFINCVFTGCQFHIYRGTFEFLRCYQENSLYIYNGEALKTLQLVALHNPGLKLGDGFLPQIHNDGTFSIAIGASI